MEELWGRCHRCQEWFHIEDPTLDAHYLCPVCLSVAYRTERRKVRRWKWRRGGGAA